MNRQVMYIWYSRDCRSGSWGFLIRDSDGDVVVTARGKVNHLLDAFHPELIACLQQIQVAVDLGNGRVIVETDAQKVVKAIKNNLYDNSTVGHLIECVYVDRYVIEPAHELTVPGHLCTEGQEIVSNSLPERVAVIVANEMLANE